MKKPGRVAKERINIIEEKAGLKINTTIIPIAMLMKTPNATPPIKSSFCIIKI